MSEEKRVFYALLDSGNARVDAASEGAIRLVRISGEIDRFDVPSLLNHFGRACGDGPDTVVQLGGITFIDTAGARALAQVITDKRAEGVNVVVGSRNAKLDRVLSVLGLDL